MPHAEPMAPRVKTLKTTMEQLHRQPELRSLAQIRDLAGMRVVVRGTRTNQDELAQQIAELFQDHERPVKVIDRRVDPRAGYRAVHLEVRQGGILIEIQIRTELQHRWAELFERAADKLGRGLRYGEPVDRIIPGTPIAELVDVLKNEADLINSIEQIADYHDVSAFELSARDQLGRLANFLDQLP